MDRHLNSESNGIDLFNHCLLCLHPFSQSETNVPDTSSSGEVGNVSEYFKHEVQYVSDPKITTFLHLWPHLGLDNESERRNQFLRAGTHPDGRTSQITSQIPPMCTTCYANVLILNDLHVQMMQIKKRLLAQATHLRGLILEGGNVDEKGENYTGRLKQFYENSLKSGVTIVALLKTMNFLCKLRRSPQLSSANKDPLGGVYEPGNSCTGDLDSQNLHLESSFFNEADFSEKELENEDEDVKLDVDVEVQDIVKSEPINAPFQTISYFNENDESEMSEGLHYYNDNNSDVKNLLKSNGRRKMNDRIEKKKAQDSRKKKTSRTKKLAAASERNDEYSPQNVAHESSSERESDIASDSDYEKPKRRKKMKKACGKLVALSKPTRGSPQKQGTSIKLYSTPTGNKKAWPRSQLCEVCNKRIRCSVMKDHLQTHITLDFIYPCPNPACGLTYITPLRRDRVHLKYAPECLEVANLTIEDVTTFQCRLCSYNVTSPISFRAHLEAHEDEYKTKSFPCPFSTCSAAFGVKQSVEMHLVRHVYKKNPSRKKKQKCLTCSKFIDVPNMEQHCLEVHKLSEIFKCRQCSFVFTSWNHLMHHKNVHNQFGEGMICDHCPVEEVGKTPPEVFESQASLVEHYSKVHGVNVGQFGCPKCKKLYSTKYRLYYHMRDSKCKEYLEVKEKVVKAKESGQLYSDSEKSEKTPILIPQAPVIEEIKKEADEEEQGQCEKGPMTDSSTKWKFGFEKSQVCEICNKRKKRSEMVEHLRSHVGEYVFQCPNRDCGLVYCSFPKQVIHTKSSPECLKACNTTAAEAAIMRCELCDFKTESKNSLQTHLENHEQEAIWKNFSCPFESCSQVFGVKQNVSFHLVSHTFYRGKEMQNLTGESSVVFTPEYDAHIIHSYEESKKQETYSEKWVLGHEKSQMCDICNKRKRRRDMVSHLRTHVKDYIYMCPNPQCALCYISPSRRAKHLKQSQECLEICNLTLDQVMTMQCQICQYVTNHPHSFKNHIQRHEIEKTEKTFQCPVSSCPKSFGIKQSVELHLPSHVFRNILSIKTKQHCPVCNKFQRLVILESHLKKSHDIEKVFRCRQCPFLFVDSKKLLRHKKTHWRNGEGAKCDLCPEDNVPHFEKYFLYLKHCKIVHGVLKDITCRTCNKTFHSEEELKQHQESGKDCDENQSETAKPKKYQKPTSFSCNACQPPIVFKSHERYLTHQVKEHDAEPYVCRICKKSYNSRATRNRHINEDHNPNSRKNKFGYGCELCGKSYTRPSSLSFHRKTAHFNHFHMCDLCGSRFHTNHKLQRHIDSTHFGIKRYECPTCKLRLTSSNGLKMHLRVHTGEKPYVCSECGKNFSQKGSLNTHLKTHSKT